MRLIKILDIVNQIERSSFLKIIDNISSELRGINSEIDSILSKGDDQIRNIDNANIVKLLHIIKPEISKLIQEKLEHNDFQLGLLTDILIRDGNSIMSREWFSHLYDVEISRLRKSISSFKPKLEEDSREIDSYRKRDYTVFRECVKTAYYNDEQRNRDKVVTRDEKSVLNTLAKNLDLSVEEIRMIYYSIVDLKKLDTEVIINSLKELGIIFFNRKTNTIYVPDEIIWLLRNLVGVELPNKYFRRILRQLKDSGINRIARKHNIDSKLTRNEKIKQILSHGISVKTVLLKGAHKDNITKLEKKEYLHHLIVKQLDIKLPRLGTTSEERVDMLIKYFQALEQDENIGISIDGYEKLLKDLNAFSPSLNKIVKTEFELQQENALSVDIMTDYSIKPLDILNLLTKDDLMSFCETYGIKTRKNIFSNILKNYEDIENLYLENYELIGARDMNALKEKGISIKESDIGIKYEELTKRLFSGLGYNVDEDLRKTTNTRKAQADIILNLGNMELIIVECKTVKDKHYNNYSGVSRQLKSYENLYKKSGYRVLQIILVSNDFTQDFIADCEYDYELNLSLISSSGLLKIMNGFINSPLSEFPIKFLLKGGKLNEDRIVSALNR